MTHLASQHSSLIVTDRSAPLADQALALADAHQILTLIGEPDGTARNGSGAHQRIFIKHGGNAFHGTEVALLLRSARTKSVVLVGASVGDMILDAADAIAHGYEAAVLVRPEQVGEAEALSRRSSRAGKAASRRW